MWNVGIRLKDILSVGLVSFRKNWTQLSALAFGILILIVKLTQSRNPHIGFLGSGLGVRMQECGLWGEAFEMRPAAESLKPKPYT